MTWPDFMSAYLCACQEDNPQLEQMNELCKAHQVLVQGNHSCIIFRILIPTIWLLIACGLWEAAALFHSIFPPPVPQWQK